MDEISKNCAIATLESALQLMRTRAGVGALEDVEAALVDLRMAYNADPDATTEAHIKIVWDKVRALELENFYNISRIWWELSGYVMQVDGPDTVWFRNVAGALEYSSDDRASWASRFPPDAHGHTRAEISDFPATMPPDAHGHTKAEISDFPATMPPDAHGHSRADIPDFPASMPPDPHGHTKAEISDFPATMPPGPHHHDFTGFVGQRLDLFGGFPQILLKGDGVAPHGLFLVLDSTYSPTAFQIQLRNKETWAYEGTVFSVSNQGATAAAWFTPACSAAWKKNIVTIPNPLELLQKTKGILFDHDKEGRSGPGVGVSAEDLEATGLPDIVARDASGQYIGIDLTKLVPVLVEAVKLLDKRVAKLETEKI